MVSKTGRPFADARRRIFTRAILQKHAAAGGQPVDDAIWLNSICHLNRCNSDADRATNVGHPGRQLQECCEPWCRPKPSDGYISLKSSKNDRQLAATRCWSVSVG